MAQLGKNLATLLLFLITSPHLHYNLFTHAASTSAPVTGPRFISFNDLDSDEDYIDEDQDNHTFHPEVISSTNTTLLHQKHQLCPHNPCLENQTPCTQLAAQSGCLCPGLSGDNVRPHAPRIQALVPISVGVNKGMVEVQWCAPNSVVSGYKVVVEGRDRDTLEFGDGVRRGLVKPLDIGTRVCVQALNKGGQNTPSQSSCMRYNTARSSDQNVLAWVIGGGVALLVLIILIPVIIWKKKVCQKGKEDSTDGLGNPSYNTEGIL